MRDRIEPKVNDYVKPDSWKFGENLKAGTSFSDSSFPGCQFRLPSCGGDLAVNIKVTGKTYYDMGAIRYACRARCRIEFVGDGTPSTFVHGWITQELR